MSTPKYKISRGSAHNIHYHVVFCPKYRRAVLRPEIAERAKELFQIAAEKDDFIIEQMEVMPDHVHLFITAKPNIAPHAIMKSLKGGSGRILRQEFPELLTLPCMWSGAYFCGTVGWVSESLIKQYIANQKGR